MFEDKIFYHIYPLGFCGAPRNNDFSSPAGSGLRSLADHIPHLQKLGINAVIIGPLFESSAHGYDTLDYFWVDRRLGTNADLKALVCAYRKAGIAVALDAVFNHSGRHFFAFKDLLQNRENSPYRDWYSGVDFGGRSPMGDAFSYHGWAGCYDLAQFNGHCRAVREHLFKAAEFWINEFDIDGLRLDAASELLPDFMDELNVFCKSLRPGFWLMGETVGGDYRNFAREGRLDSVTNYAMYKGLWSCFNDHNFYEIAWTLNQQYGAKGIYRNLTLYNFTDNHDVNRAASVLRDKAHLFPLYGLLFTVPGIPSIYYGSEFGITGERTKNSDYALRPRWDKEQWEKSMVKEAADGNNGYSNGADLEHYISQLIQIRRSNPALWSGPYRELFLSHNQFAFLREDEHYPIAVAVNSERMERSIVIPPAKLPGRRRWKNLFSGEILNTGGEGLSIPLKASELLILRGE